MEGLVIWSKQPSLNMPTRIELDCVSFCGNGLGINSVILGKPCLNIPLTGPDAARGAGCMLCRPDGLSLLVLLSLRGGGVGWYEAVYPGLIARC